MATTTGGMVGKVVGTMTAGDVPLGDVAIVLAKLVQNTELGLVQVSAFCTGTCTVVHGTIFTVRTNL